MQRNPFFEELLAEESQRSPPFVPRSSSASSPFHYTTVPSQPCTPGSSYDINSTNTASIKRERPRPVARQTSLPASLSQSAATHDSTNLSAPRSMSDSAGEWDDSFDAFASSRLNSPKGSLSQKQLKPSPSPSHRHSYGPVYSNNHTHELQTCEEEPPPLPPRRPLRTPVNELYSDGWLHRGQELAVHKEAYLLSQTGVASLQRGREAESKRNSISPDPHTSSETSDSLSVHSQPGTNNTSPGFLCEEKRQKFKYEPLEDDNNCWGGMLFEQDLYGRTCRGNYRQPKAKNPHLSLHLDETGGSNITFTNSGPKMLLNNEKSVTDLLKISNATSPNPDIKPPDIKATPVEETEEEYGPPETCINNNMSFSLTLGDLNMNNSDFSFIDSDGSPQSDVADNLKGISIFGGTFLDPPEDSQMAVYQSRPTPEDLLTLKDNHIPETNSSLEITASPNKLCKVLPVCQNYRCELNNKAPHGPSRVNSRENQTLDSPIFKTESRDDDTIGDDAFKKIHRDFDKNGNPQAKLSTAKKTESSSGVVSARFRPTGSRQDSRGSSNSNTSRDREFEQLLSLVQNISEVSEGPLSYQPTKSAVSTLLTLDERTDVALHHCESNTEPQMLSKGDTGKPFEISFEDLHAKVAPNSRTPSKSKIGQSLQKPDPSSPSIPCALSLSADTQASLHPTPLCCTSIHPSIVGPSAGASSTLSVAPYTSSSSSATCTSDRPPIDAHHSLLPEETQPASNLPHQESR